MSDQHKIWFYRTWTKYNGGTSGGQLKVFDAFNHARYSNFEPVVYFPPKTKWFDNPGNHWQPLRHSGQERWSPKKEDLIFFSGKDWEVLTPEERVSPPAPILNIVQPRHIDLKGIRHEALQYPAIRIVKSRVAEKILKDFGVKDPFFYIPDAINLDLLPPPVDKDLDILIVGLKNEPMARRLHSALKFKYSLLGVNYKIHCQIPPKLPKRSDFLSLVNRAKLVVFLPLPIQKGGEGFYLPALEAMAMGSFVICPDVIGNRDFCLDGKTCLMPRYNIWGYLKAIRSYHRLSDSDRNHVIQSAAEIVQNHTIEKERGAYIDLISRAHDIWNDSFGS